MRWFDDRSHGSIDGLVSGPITCAGDAALIRLPEGLQRCTRSVCGPLEPTGEFADLIADGIASATQRGSTVRLSRTNQPAVDVQLDDGDQVVAMVVWNERPTLVVLGASKRLHFATLPM